MKSRLNILFEATVIIAAVLFAAIAYFQGENLWGIILDILFETVSICLTIGVIDFLIQKQEKKRWHFREVLLLARAFDCLDEFLLQMLPQEVRELSSKIYSHGRIHVVPFIEPYSEKTLENQLPILLKERIESGSVPFTTYNETITVFRDSLDHILDHYSTLPDHNIIIDELLDLRYTYLLSLPKNDLKDENEIAGAVDEWVDVILKVAEVREVLLEQMRQEFTEV